MKELEKVERRKHKDVTEERRSRRRRRYVGLGKKSTRKVVEEVGKFRRREEV